MCRAVTAGDRLRARGDVAVYVSVRVNHVVADQSPISRRIYWLLWTNKDLDRRTATIPLLTDFLLSTYIVNKKLSYRRETRATLLSVEMLFYCCTNNTNRSPVSLRSTFSNRYVLFSYMHSFVHASLK